VLEEGDFSSDFHIYGLQRLPGGFRFFVDGILIGETIPPPGGFWELGKLDRNPGGVNIWENGTTITPFDYPVRFLVNSPSSFLPKKAFVDLKFKEFFLLYYSINSNSINCKI